jgi:L-malate glycosyltransferase
MEDRRGWQALAEPLDIIDALDCHLVSRPLAASSVSSAVLSCDVPARATNGLAAAAVDLPSEQGFAACPLPMPRILHIARITTAATERRVSLMAAEPGFSFRLVRTAAGATADLEGVRRQARVEDIRRVAMPGRRDPHRGVYGTLGFGIRQFQPDIIHAEEEPDSLAALQVAVARRMLAPQARLVLFTWQNVDRPKNAAVTWVLHRALLAADAVVCGNAGAVAVLRQFGYHRPAPIIPALALDTAVFHRRLVPRPTDAFTVGYVGRLAPEKGVDTLIDAVAAIGPPVHLAVAGAGPSREELEARVRGAGLDGSTRFAGALDPAGVASFLNAIDVLVVPSRSTPVWREQYGRVIIEAMGCEVPVVGSDSGAIPEVVGDAGLIFPEGDSRALGRHLRDLRESPERRRAIGRRGFARAASGHTAEVRAGQFLAFYRELLAAPARGER